MKYTNTIVVGMAIAAATIGFFGGTYYQKGQANKMGIGNFNFHERGRNSQQGDGRSDARGMNNGGNSNGMLGMRGGNMTSGEVTSMDDKSMTVKMSDGSSKIVLLSESTTYSMSESTTKDKVTVGSKVAVFGTSTNDGSLTASSIELNPTFRGQN